MQTFNFTICAPVPVGHRVEIFWYKFNDRAAKSPLKSPSHRPLVRDMETGIIYGPIDLFLTSKKGHSTVANSEKPLPTQWDVLPDAELESTLRGRVLACRLLSFQAGEDMGLQTTLIIEPEPEKGAYR